ncbi:hypothetical protein Q5P01_005732 [Channa striata]|uniref:Uncharacterized protein n=1 Tax=Channa striata TaxID=64152 RepID=A0AA88NEJ3_CHASR|nr:hypothetical protein Q5P01_005732 [Channa striata]
MALRSRHLCTFSLPDTVEPGCRSWRRRVSLFIVPAESSMRGFSRLLQWLPHRTHVPPERESGSAAGRRLANSQLGAQRWCVGFTVCVGNKRSHLRTICGSRRRKRGGREQRSLELKNAVL